MIESARKEDWSLLYNRPKATMRMTGSHHEEQQKATESTTGSHREDDRSLPRERQKATMQQ